MTKIRFNRDIFSTYVNTPNLEGSSQSKDFIKNSSLITVRQIHSGNLKVPLSNAFNLKHPSCSGIEDKEIVVPILAYLIHHEKYGYYLIDTGCESSYVNNSYGPMRGIILSSVMPETFLEPDNAIDKQLIDVRNDIKGVFFTHLHFDHTSGVPALPDNLIYVAGKGEEYISIKLLVEPNHFNKNDIVYVFDFNSEESRTHPIGKAIDIFGDNSLLAISTPGHSKGHVSYLANTKEHPILIAGDSCIINKSMETGVGPGTSSKNIKHAQKTFEKIYNFVKNNPNVKLWPGHDFAQ